MNALVRRKDIGLVTRLVPRVDNVATGALMRQARLKAGLTLREMARRLKCSAPYVCDLELGRRGWNESRLEEWARILCTSNTPGERICEPSAGSKYAPPDGSVLNGGEHV